jgi:hypothetical protein
MKSSANPMVKVEEEELPPRRPYDPSEPPIIIEDDPAAPKQKSQRYRPRDLGWRLINTKRTQVKLICDSPGECSAIMNVPITYPSKFLPIDIKVREVKIKIPGHSQKWVNPNEIHSLSSSKEIHQPLVEMRSQHYPRSLF